MGASLLRRWHALAINNGTAIIIVLVAVTLHRFIIQPMSCRAVGKVKFPAVAQQRLTFLRLNSKSVAYGRLYIYWQVVAEAKAEAEAEDILLSLVLNSCPLALLSATLSLSLSLTLFVPVSAAVSQVTQIATRTGIGAFLPFS